MPWLGRPRRRVSRELEPGSCKWRGFFTEEGNAVVPPVFVHANCRKMAGEPGDGVELFLLCSISTHPHFPADNSTRVMFNGVWCIRSIRIDAWVLDPTGGVKHKDKQGVFYIDADWSTTPSRDEIHSFDPVDFEVLANSMADLHAVPNVLTLAGILNRQRTQHYIRPTAMDPPLWEAVRAQLV